MHELGGALFTKKKIISVLCGVAPGQLPEWVRDRQAIDLEEKDQIVSTVEKIADAIRSDKFLAGLVAGGLVLFALWLVFGGRNEEG